MPPRPPRGGPRDRDRRPVVRSRHEHDRQRDAGDRRPLRGGSLAAPAVRRAARRARSRTRSSSRSGPASASSPSSTAARSRSATSTATRSRSSRTSRANSPGRAGRTQLLLDGYLTHQPIQGIAAVAYRERPIGEAPPPRSARCGSVRSAGRAGGTGRRRSRRSGASRRPRTRTSRSSLVDLLWLDDEPLLAVPLLERKRILESVVDESRPRPARDLRPAADRYVGRLVARVRVQPARLQGARTAATRRARRTPQWAIGEMPVR